MAAERDPRHGAIIPGNANWHIACIIPACMLKLA